MGRIESVVDSAYMLSVDARLESSDAYVDYQVLEARRAVPFFAKFFRIEGARVLEVGTGRGGKGIAYAQAGMCVTAFDVDAASLAHAARAAQKHQVDARLLAADGARLPFVSDYFDAILIDSVLEHVADSLAVLQECKRVLKRGGIVFVAFPPFYAPLSGHIDDFVMIPWFHLLPRSIVKKFLLSRSQPLGILAPSEAYAVYTTLNRLTIFRFMREARQAGLHCAYFQARPFLTHPGNRLVVGLMLALRHPPRLQNLCAVIARARREFSFGVFLLFLLVSALTLLVRVPFAQEIAAGGVKAVLRKG